MNNWWEQAPVMEDVPQSNNWWESAPVVEAGNAPYRPGHNSPKGAMQLLTSPNERTPEEVANGLQSGGMKDMFPHLQKQTHGRVNRQTRICQSPDGKYIWNGREWVPIGGN